MFISGYLFVDERVHRVHCFGAVVGHDRVKQLGDQLRPLAGVRGGLFRPMSLVEHLSDHESGVVQRPNAVESQTEVVNAGSELMNIRILPSFLLTNSFVV